MQALRLVSGARYGRRPAYAEHHVSVGNLFPNRVTAPAEAEAGSWLKLRVPSLSRSEPGGADRHRFKAKFPGFRRTTDGSTIGQSRGPEQGNLVPLLLPAVLRWGAPRSATDFGETAILAWERAKKIYKIGIFVFEGVARQRSKSRNTVTEGGCPLQFMFGSLRNWSRYSTNAAVECAA